MKWFRKGMMCLVTMLLAACMCFSGAFTSVTKAYTEEEKAQAKAWLSAHGYAPTREGAEAAYQDYLNGKFDEELGISHGSDSENIGDSDGGSSSSSGTGSGSIDSDKSSSGQDGSGSTAEEGTTTDEANKTDQSQTEKTTADGEAGTSATADSNKKEATEIKTAKQSEQKIKNSMIPIAAAGVVLVVAVLGCVGLIWKRRRE